MQITKHWKPRVMRCQSRTEARREGSNNRDCQTMVAPTHILTWAFNALVVIRIDADILLFETKRVLAAVNGLQFVMALKVWPTPHTTVYNMGKALAMRYLQPTVQTPSYGHAFRRNARVRERFLQFLQPALLLFQLLYQRVYSFLCPLFFLVTLLPSEQPFHSRRRKVEQRRHDPANRVTFGHVTT